MFSRRYRLWVVVLALTAVSYLALIGLGWRSLNRSETALARALRQASSRSAQELAQQLHRDLKSPVFNLLEQVDHPAIRNLQFADISNRLRELSPKFQMIDTFFIWSLGPEAQRGYDASTADADILFYSFCSSSHSEASVPPGGEEREFGFFAAPQFAAILHEEARTFGASRRNYALSYVPFGGRLYQVLYHFLYDESDRRLLWGFEGVLVDSGHHLPEYFAEVLSEWGQQDGSQSLALAVTVLDDRGRPVSRIGRSLLTDYESDAKFPFLLFDLDLFDSLMPSPPPVRYWTVRTGYEAGSIDTIVQEESRRQRQIWLLVGLVAVAGIVLTIRATAREIQFGELQAEFIANVSHDLKTPLAKIQLFADTLKAGRARTPEKVDTYLQVISAQARNLGDMLASLLDFSRIEAGVTQLDLQHSDLRALISAAIDAHDHELSVNGFRVEVLLPHYEVLVHVNPESMRQVFGNLISNTLKYSPGEKFLRIRLQTINGNALVELTDRGVGILPNERRKIFKKFCRGSGALTTHAPGSGLGLSIVERVLRAHGGAIDVASVPGRGSTFTVRLPFSREVHGGEGSDS